MRDPASFAGQVGGAVDGSASGNSRHLLTAGWVTVAVVPLLGALIASQRDWVPFGDTAMITALTADTLTGDPPLVGMPTSLSAASERILYHPGPIGFWLVALPSRLLGAPGHGMLLGAALVSAASLAGVGVLARQHADRTVEALLLALVAAMVAAMGATRLADPFNPFLGMAPFLLFLVAAWGVLSGHARQLWAVVLGGSVAAQLHLGYVPLVGAVGALVVAGLVLDVRRAGGDRRRRITRLVVPVAVALGVAVWMGPLIDQVTGDHNLTGLAGSQGSSEQGTLGWGHALDVATEMTSVPPRWAMKRAGDELFDPGAVRVALSLASVAGVVGLAAWGLRHGQRTVVALGATSLLGVVVATASTSRAIDGASTEEAVLYYRLFWWPLGVLFTLTLLLGLVRVLTSRRTPGLARRPGGAVWVGALGLVAAVAALVVAPIGGRGGTFPDPHPFGPYVEHGEAVADLPGRPRTVVLRFTAPGLDPRAEPAYFHGQGLIAQLRLHGIEVRFEPTTDDAGSIINSYRRDHPATGDEAVRILYRVTAGVADERPTGYRRISLVPTAPGAELSLFNAPSAVFVEDR